MKLVQIKRNKTEMFIIKILEIEAALVDFNVSKIQLALSVIFKRYQVDSELLHELKVYFRLEKRKRNPLLI